ncbi:MAG: shikimate dehydrogenase [Muribaculaceae bacterium]|nr:shikimate dehydrogenase [Muribaculaceae bacterium]
MMNYALIGRKLSHSFSADFFNEKFRREGISSHYSLVELADFDELLPYLANHSDIIGLNVTIPYKEDAYRLCHRLTPQAEAIGAVNTIRICRTDDGQILLYGTNTDAPGFAESVADAVRIRKSALVLGTGGASKAVSYALEEAGVKVTKVSRHRCEDQSVITYDELSPSHMEENLLIVNTTPLGMFPNVNEAPAIPYKDITEKHFCYDVVYNPEETLFMRLCAERGAKTRNGLQMLYNQALLAWDFWRE